MKLPLSIKEVDLDDITHLALVVDADGLTVSKDALVAYVNGLSGRAEEAPTGGWISVKDRTPEMNLVQVLAYSPNVTQDGEQIWMCLSDAFRSAEWLRKYNVTHWTPLPSAPSEKGRT